MSVLITSSDLAWGSLFVALLAALGLVVRRMARKGAAHDPGSSVPCARSTARVYDVTLGGSAQRPVRLGLPLLILGLGALGDPGLRQAVAEASSLTGSAVEGGPGAGMAAEREVAHCFVRRLDGGGLGWLAASAPVVDLLLLAAREIGPAGAAATADAEEPERATDLHHALACARYLRGRAAGRPIGIELSAGPRLEVDLALLLRQHVDVVVLRGGSRPEPSSAAQPGAVDVRSAIDRADGWLRRCGLRDRLSIVARTKLTRAGDLGGLLRLGADAVAVDAADLLAVAFGAEWRRSGSHDRDALAVRVTDWLRGLHTELDAPHVASDAGADAFSRADATTEALATGIAMAIVLRENIVLWRQGLGVWRDMHAVLRQPQEFAQALGDRAAVLTT